MNIKNYKLFKRKYATFDKNGLAKEYGLFDNKLIYEGEYLNSERNGKGKEYNNNGQLIYKKRISKWNQKRKRKRILW